LSLPSARNADQANGAAVSIKVSPSRLVRVAEYRCPAALAHRFGAERTQDFSKICAGLC
jgi:hypothetical protein